MALLRQRLSPYVDEKQLHALSRPAEDPCEERQATALQALHQVLQRPPTELLVAWALCPVANGPLEPAAGYADETSLAQRRDKIARLGYGQAGLGTRFNDQPVPLCNG